MKHEDTDLERSGATRAEFFKNISDDIHKNSQTSQGSDLQSSNELPTQHALLPSKEVALLLDHLSIAREESKEALSLARETIEYIKESSKEMCQLKDTKIENLEMKIEKKDRKIENLQKSSEKSSLKLKELEETIEKLKKENEDLQTFPDSGGHCTSMILSV